VRLATIRAKENSRDGQLVVVSEDGMLGAPVREEGITSLREALEKWSKAEPILKLLAKDLAAGNVQDLVELNEQNLLASLPRAWSFIDGSAYIQHIILVRKARGAEPPEDLRKIPLMYQGINDYFLAPFEDIPLEDPEFGLDFEAEVAVILDEVPQGTKVESCAQYIKLIVLLNDISLRNLIPRELKAGFGFFHGKPRSALSPFAITPDELGALWKDGRVHLPLRSKVNGEWFGEPDAGEMFFSFFELIAHAAKTRPLPAGTILGSGTVSNEDESKGSSCLAEKRMLEKIKDGEARTPFLDVGDEVEMWMEQDGRDLFGRIKQRVVQFT